MYQESFNGGAIPPSLKTTLITLPLKSGKPSTDCGSYRPISLLNNDIKILCKVLEKRLEPILTEAVHPDQNGFVQGGQDFHNIRQVFNILFEKSGSLDNAFKRKEGRSSKIVLMF